MVAKGIRCGMPFRLTECEHSRPHINENILLRIFDQKSISTEVKKRLEVYGPLWDSRSGRALLEYSATLENW